MLAYLSTSLRIMSTQKTVQNKFLKLQIFKFVSCYSSIKNNNDNICYCFNIQPIKFNFL